MINVVRKDVADKEYNVNGETVGELGNGII